MKYYLVSYNKLNMTNNNLTHLKKIIPSMMEMWADDENLNNSHYVYDDILLVLQFLNKKFIINHSKYYDKTNKQSLNIFKSKNTVTVDACGAQETKLFKDYTAEDYKNIDVWRSEQLYTYDVRNRYQNRFPVWQYSMNSRQYDRSNDGLHDAYSNRASLDNQTRGYNMHNIIKGSTFYTNSEYENI